MSSLRLVTPHPQPRRISCADTARLVRQALKEAFPGVKFSVKSTTYSGGASIDVSWADGPLSAEVDGVVSRFAGATFDSSQDLKVLHHSELNGERVKFAADYIFTNRRRSVE